MKVFITCLLSVISFNSYGYIHNVDIINNLSEPFDIEISLPDNCDGVAPSYKFQVPAQGHLLYGVKYHEKPNCSYRVGGAPAKKQGGFSMEARIWDSATIFHKDAGWKCTQEPPLNFAYYCYLKNGIERGMTVTVTDRNIFINPS